MGIFNSILSILKKNSDDPKEKDNDPKQKNKRLVEEEKIEEREIVIGFDFGTAFTKVIIGDNLASQSYAISFGRLGSSENEYLIPSRIFCCEDNSVSLSKEDGREVPNLKLGLLKNNPDSTQGCQLATLYIALVLRESRNWFFKNYGDIYKNKKIIWALNLGLPSRSYEEGELQLRFRSLAIAGWALSQLNEKLTIESVDKILNEAKSLLTQTNQISTPENFLPIDDINVIPEIIAEVVGYTKSDLRINGLHMVLDIGASTADLSAFIIHNSEIDDQYSILTAEVEHFGVINLDNANNGEDSLATFEHEFYKFVGNTNKELNENRCRNDWERGFPLFMCGGGAKIKFYRNVLNNLEYNLKLNTRFSGFNFKQIPIPRNLKAPRILNDSYHRLAVAYGLSFRGMDIGQIIPRSIISDLAPPSPPPLTNKQYYEKKEGHNWW